jgi:hypothetical protein
MLEFSFTGQEVSRRGSIGFDENGHTAVVALGGRATGLRGLLRLTDNCSACQMSTIF